ncbi:MAG: DegT/DnrJ/EryC1/StrS family aminotransferase [Acidobacteria bacterium]|nr:DegT/DnrJ/EryC1/StrS family aminotransferase [Acidobacteriota bacterium]
MAHADQPHNIYVTQPFMPPLDEFVAYLEKIWDSRWLTNVGEFHRELERALAEYLGVKYIALFANGTLALITALQALRITGEVITTPFSFVATAHALHWNGIKPVFVDIEPEFCNLDPEKVESAITPRTTAILPVHVYGNPCNVKRLQQIADIYGLKLIYDGAHAFGVTLDGMSVFNHGDLSVLSFHATKVYTTIEGGAIVCPDEKMKQRIDFLKNFGFAGEVTVVAPGINAKMNEVQAAFGLLQLKYVGEAIARRGRIAKRYREALADVPGIRLLPEMDGVRQAHPYFPIFIDIKDYGASRDDVYNAFKRESIHVRRYFYPLISQFPTYRNLETSRKGNLPVAECITDQVLCLPIHPELLEDQQDRIISILREA